MPLQVCCPECNTPHQVQVKDAGRSLRCSKPGCRGVIQVPPLAVPLDWHVRTPLGERHDSKSKPELDSWAAEGRLTGDCLVRQDGWPDWKWACEIWPSLGPPPPDGRWYVRKPDGLQDGPMTKKELDRWAADERLTGRCQVRKEGWDGWKGAREVYPWIVEAGRTPRSPPGDGNEPPRDGPAWFVCAQDGQQWGPVSEVQLHLWVATGRVGKSFLLLQEGWPQWKAASDVYPWLWPPSEPGDITRSMRAALAKTRSWAITFSIAGFVWGGLGIFHLTSALLDLVDISAPAKLVFMMLLYITCHVLLIVASLYSLKYALELGRLPRHQAVSVQQLGPAITVQAPAWQWIAITTVTFVATLLLTYLMLRQMVADLLW